MGQDQHTSLSVVSTSRGRRLHPRICLRKGCGRVFQPRRWNQRYCQDPECLRLVRRWQAAKRQRQHRQANAHRQRHCQAERQRRQQRRQQASGTGGAFGSEDTSKATSPPRDAKEDGAWSRSKNKSADFCDRVGCYEPLRPSSRAAARYCGDACRQAMRQVVDRERKWLRRNTYVGHFKRKLEYQQARRQRTGQRDPLGQAPPARVADSRPFGRQLFEFW